MENKKIKASFSWKAGQDEGNISFVCNTNETITGTIETAEYCARKVVKELCKEMNQGEGIKDNEIIIEEIN